MFFQNVIKRWSKVKTRAKQNCRKKIISRIHFLFFLLHDIRRHQQIIKYLLFVFIYKNCMKLHFSQFFSALTSTDLRKFYSYFQILFNSTNIRFSVFYYFVIVFTIERIWCKQIRRKPAAKFISSSFLMKSEPKNEEKCDWWCHPPIFFLYNPLWHTTELDDVHCNKIHSILGLHFAW